jgi:hypothetical protein
MSKPLVVTIPHRLGKEEAVRRMKAGLDKVMQPFGSMLTVVRQDWTDNHLEFRVRAVGQTTGGKVDVEEDHVRLEVELPWGLGALAGKAKSIVQQSGKLLLEKK